MKHLSHLDHEALADADRLLGDLGARRLPADAGQDPVVAALAAWVASIDVEQPRPATAHPAQAGLAQVIPLPVRGRGRHRVSRRLVGGAVLTGFALAGSSVAAALTGTHVPVLSAVGSALVDIVPDPVEGPPTVPAAADPAPPTATQVTTYAQSPASRTPGPVGPERPVAVPAATEAATPVPASPAERESARPSSAPRPEAARPSPDLTSTTIPPASGGQVQLGTSWWVVPAADQPWHATAHGPAPADRSQHPGHPPWTVHGQDEVPESIARPGRGDQAAMPGAPGPVGTPRHEEQTTPGRHAQLTGPPEHAALTGPPEHAALTGRPEHAALIGPPEHAALIGPPEHAVAKGEGTSPRRDDQTGRPEAPRSSDEAIVQPQLPTTGVTKDAAEPAADPDDHGQPVDPGVPAHPADPDGSGDTAGPGAPEPAVDPAAPAPAEGPAPLSPESTPGPSGASTEEGAAASSPEPPAAPGDPATDPALAP